MNDHPRRSVLYVPATNERALAKAPSLDADSIIFDLEDAVVPEQKATARDLIQPLVAGGAYRPKELVVRINGLSTPWGRDDLAALAGSGVDAVLVPKVKTVDEVQAAAIALHYVERPPALWLMIETPHSILNLREIAACATAPGARLTCFVMGTNDLIKATGAELDAARTQALYWFSATLTAARAHGIVVLDGVYNDFRDSDGFRSECVHGRKLGMDGKTVIHPNQIAIANEVYSPSAEDIDWARSVIAAFELPENQNKGAIQLDGQMVERLHIDIARRILSRAGASIAPGTGAR